MAERDTAGTVVEVALFEDRASVTRRFPVTAGRQRVRLGPLTPLVSERRLAFPVGGLVIEDARVERAQVAREVADPARVRELALAVRAAEQDAAAARAVRERAREREARASALAEAGLEAASRALGEADRPEEWLAAVARLAGRLAEAKRALAASEAAVGSSEAEGAARRAALVAARAGTSVEQAWLVLDVVAPPGADHAEVAYTVPGAVWRPAHRATLTSGGPGPGTLEVETRAIAWNATGEDWETPRLVCSTARPGAAATPPRLEDDVVTAGPRAAEVVVEARDERIEVARERRGRASAELPGVDDGGEARVYRVDAGPGGPIRIPSTGRPVAVPLDAVSSEATLRWVAAPELGSRVVARVTGRNAGARPLLAGPIALRRAAPGGRELLHVGVGQLGLVPAGEPFSLGMGSADGVRVTRKRTDEHHVQLVTGRQTHTVTVEIRVAHAGDAPLAVRIEERIPVSDLREVAVGAPRAEPALDGPPDRDGFVSWTLELAPGDHRTLTLVVVIDASSNVTLPF